MLSWTPARTICASAPFLAPATTGGRTTSCSWVYMLIVLTAMLASSPLARQIWQGYASALSAHPLWIKAVTAAFFQSLSDALTQRLTTGPCSERKGYYDFSHNWKRTRQALLTGLLWSGPVGHCWFPLLERIVATLFATQSFDSPVLRLLVKIVLDALLFSPFTIVGYLVVSTIVSSPTKKGSGSTNWRLQQASTAVKTKFWPVLTAAWRFWPIVNAVSFACVPIHFRVLYSNVWSLVWTGYMSYVNNLPAPQQHNSSSSSQTRNTRQRRPMKQQPTTTTIATASFHQ